MAKAPLPALRKGLWRLIFTSLVAIGSLGPMACSTCEPVEGSHEPSSKPNELPSVPETLVFPDRPLRFGQPPHLDIARSEQEYQGLADYLSTQLGHPVELVIGANYGAVIEDLVGARLDMALLTPYPYLAAKKRQPGLQMLVSVLAEGSPRYRGYIVVKADSPMQALPELKGKRFAFVDRRSTSGYLFPLIALREAGIEPERDFAEITFGGSHPQVVQWVLDGTVDAGAMSSTTFQHLRAQFIERRVKIIGKTEWVPFGGFVVHPALSNGVIERLRAILLDLNVRSEAGRGVLSGMATINGFVLVDDSHYDTVRQILAAEDINLHY